MNNFEEYTEYLSKAEYHLALNYHWNYPKAHKYVTRNFNKFFKDAFEMGQSAVDSAEALIFALKQSKENLNYEHQ